MILSEKDLQLLNSLPASEPESDKKDNDLKIEFDGTTVLCRVCGDKASGFHYGVHSCEGCKGFFRRSIQQKIQYRPCTKNQQCSILRINRNRCQYCRLKKCIAVGMSRDAVRFGRVPKREKAKILAAMQKVNACSQEKALCAELEDEFRVLSTIIQAHEETCDYTKDKVAPLVERARTQPVFTQCPPQLACPLNPAPHALDNGGTSRIMEDFSERFSPAIRGVVEFAKRIPGFSLLAQDDQVTLLKAGVFEVLLVRLACMFDSQANSLICLNGQVLRRESLHSASNARFLLDSMFDFAERLNALRLADSELGLFCAVVVIAADRPGLRNTELVHKIQKKLTSVLQKAVSSTHPEHPSIFGELMKKIPDLRTLNTLHSEKLLAYKMEPRNQASGIVSPSSTITTTITNSTNAYGIPQDIWSQYSLIATHQQPLVSEEDNRSTSPSQQSQHGGSTTGSEWSTTDSKDGHDLIGSPRSIGSALSTDEVKSPVRSSSFSSTRSYENESVWASGDVVPPQEFQPLPKRTNGGSEHGSSSGDEGYYVDSPVKGTVYPKIRRVDSPTDSGIESGKEHGPSTTPTISGCSSPQSAMEEKVKDMMDAEVVEKQEIVEDMPYLKRALQAPPLVNTTLLMDEAYRNHKKFRAARRDTDNPSSPCGLSLASTHSTLVKTLEQAPRYLSEQQLKRTDLIHTIIMRTEAVPVNGHQREEPSPTGIAPPPPQQLAVNNNFQYTTATAAASSGVPSISPSTSPLVPPTLVATSNSPSNKSVGCPSGYYIPHSSVAMPGYSTSSVSWPFASSPVQSNGPSMATSPVHIRTHFEHYPHQNSHHHQSPVPAMSTSSQSTVSSHQNTSMSASTPLGGPRLMYNPRSPAASSTPSPLVIPGGLATSTTPPMNTPSPMQNCQLESRLLAMTSPTPPSQAFHGESTDAQPLNLSKKSLCPPVLKIES